MEIHVKRAYDPYHTDDGWRILADRLWPRGVRKESAHIDEWAKDIAPSNELRSWFHTDPGRRYEEFALRYEKELAPKKAEAKALLTGKKRVTLVTAARDVDHSHIPTLMNFLKRMSS